MHIHRKYKPELCTSKDETRPVLAHVLATKDFPRIKGGALVSTDGMRILAVPMIEDPEDELGMIPVDLLKVARKQTTARQPNANITMTHESRLAEPVSKTTVPRPEGDFPNAARCVPGEFKHPIKIALNAKYLLDIQKAMDAKSVVLTFESEESSPILVTTVREAAYGVLMPHRAEEALALQKARAVERAQWEKANGGEAVDQDLPVQEKPEKPETEAEAEDREVAEAIVILKETRRASTSAIQRRMRIGYTKAARLMDVLEERKIIGPPRGSEPREILIELEEKKDEPAKTVVPF